MAKTFRPDDRDQLRLMPPALADWVPEGHLARFVSDLVDDLDLARAAAGDPDPSRPDGPEAAHYAGLYGAQYPEAAHGERPA